MALASMPGHPLMKPATPLPPPSPRPTVASLTYLCIRHLAPVYHRPHPSPPTDILLDVLVQKHSNSSRDPLKFATLRTGLAGFVMIPIVL